MGGTESLAPPGAKDGVEPKGLTGLAGRLRLPFSGVLGAHTFPAELQDQRVMHQPVDPVSPNSRTRLSALLSVAGAWSQCMRKIEGRLSTNPEA